MIDEGASALEQALLLEGRTYQLPEKARYHTLATLGLTASAGVTGGVMGWLASRSGTTKVVLALSTATLLAAIPLGYVFLGKDGPKMPPAVSVVVPQVPPIPPAAEAPAIPAPAAVVAPAPEVPLSPRPATTGSDLRAELAALDTIRSALSQNETTTALSSLAAYFRSFPRGRLHLEAEALRIDALAQAGQRERAERFARAFLRKHPGSVLTARVRPYAER